MSKGARDGDTNYQDLQAHNGHCECYISAVRERLIHHDFYTVSYTYTARTWKLSLVFSVI